MKAEIGFEVRGITLLTSILLSLIILSSFSPLASGGVDTAWVRYYGGAGESGAWPMALEVDTAGNVYVTGDNGNDIATLKYDANGNLLWERRYNGDRRAWPCALDVDNEGSVYVAGTIEGVGYYSAIVIKYNTAGDSQWVKLYDGATCDLDVGPTGNIYVTGGTYSTGSAAGTDIRKYASDGTLMWSRSYNPGSCGNTMRLDSQENVYVAGLSYSQVTYSDVYCQTLKYSADGGTLWQRLSQLPHVAGACLLLGIGWNYKNMDITKQYVYVSGYSEDTINSQCLRTLLKYNIGGNLLQTRRFAASLTPPGLPARVKADPAGYIYCDVGANGITKYDTDLNFLWNVQRIGAMEVDADSNLYVAASNVTAKYDSDGNLLWEAYNDGASWDLVLDSLGNVYATGSSSAGRYVTIKYVQDVVPVVLVHGWRPLRDKVTQEIAVWDQMKEWLQEEGFEHVWVVDNLGDCGYRSEKQFDKSAESLSVFIQHNIDALEDTTELFVEKVDIIAHSMGGLVARRYISEPDKPWRAGSLAKQLIMLATPNGGIGGATVFGMVAEGIVKLLDLLTCKGPIVKESSIKKMRDFNDTYWQRGDTKYSGIAGNCSSMCPPDNQDCMRCRSALVWGPHDGLFSVSTVLLEELNLDYECEAIGPGYAHTKITRDFDLTHDVIIPLLRDETPTGSMCGSDAEELTAMTPDTSVLDFLHASVGVCDSLSWTDVEVTMEAGDSAAFVVYGLAGDVEVTLEDPSSIPIDSIVAQNDPDNYWYSSVLGIVTYGVFNPSDGIWTVRVRAITMLDTVAPYLLLVDSENGIKMSATVDSSEFWLGSDIGLLATVTDDGLGVPGCSVVVAPVYEDGTMFDEFLLFDDGQHNDGTAEDGSYGGTFAGAAQPGLYAFQVTAMGSTITSGSFRRLAALEAWVKCDCGVWGDVNDDGALNPVDVVFMVNHVYLSNDMRIQPPFCPNEAGDVNCDGGVNPVDLVFYVNYVYLTNDMFCADPCEE